MKVSIVSVILNCEEYLRDCICSVIRQDYPDIEYIIIDGGSVDGTLGIIEEFRTGIQWFISEKDRGFYDGLNKGIRLATGEIIGLLSGDDVLADPGVISGIVNHFRTKSCDGIYGNLIYTYRKKTARLFRRWKPGEFNLQKLYMGWMPPHPTLYLRRDVYQRFGLYSNCFGSSGDYEFILRLFSGSEVNMIYIDQLIVKMRRGGISNNGLRSILNAFMNDYRALVKNQFNWPLFIVVCKKLRKIHQFFHRKDIIGKYLTYL